MRKPGTHIPQHRRAQVAGSLMSTSRDLLRRCAKEQTWCESSLLLFFYIVIFCIFVSSPCIRSVSEKTNGENPKVTSTHPWNLKRCRWWCDDDGDDDDRDDESHDYDDDENYGDDLSTPVNIMENFIWIPFNTSWWVLTNKNFFNFETFTFSTNHDFGRIFQLDWLSRRYMISFDDHPVLIIIQRQISDIKGVLNDPGIKYPVSPKASA